MLVNPALCELIQVILELFQEYLVSQRILVISGQAHPLIQKILEKLHQDPRPFLIRGLLGLELLLVVFWVDLEPI